MIYFACALKHGGLSPETLEVYNFISTTVRTAGYEIYMQHEEPLPTLDCVGVYKHSIEKVRSAKLLILYAGIEAFGSGMEFGYASIIGIPTITIAETTVLVDRRISITTSHLIRFGSLKSLKDQLLQIIQQYVEKDKTS